MLNFSLSLTVFSCLLQAPRETREGEGEGTKTRGEPGTGYVFSIFELAFLAKMALFASMYSIISRKHERNLTFTFAVNAIPNIAIRWTLHCKPASV